MNHYKETLGLIIQVLEQPQAEYSLKLKALDGARQLLTDLERTNIPEQRAVATSQMMAALDAKGPLVRRTTDGKTGHILARNDGAFALWHVRFDDGSSDWIPSMHMEVLR